MLYKKNLSVQIENKNYQRQQHCREGTGAYSRPQIEHELRMNRKLMKKAPSVLALNGCYREGTVTVLLG